MGNNLSQGEFLSIFWSNELFLDRSYVSLVFNMPISELAADIFGGTCFSRAGRTSNDQIFGKAFNLIFKRKIKLYLLSSESFQKVNGAIETFAELIVIWFNTIGEQLEWPCATFKLAKLLRAPWEVGEEYLTSIQVFNHDFIQQLDFVSISLSL
jgi:hypothetical protein